MKNASCNVNAKSRILRNASEIDRSQVKNELDDMTSDVEKCKDEKTNSDKTRMLHKDRIHECKNERMQAEQEIERIVAKEKRVEQLRTNIPSAQRQADDLDREMRVVLVELSDLEQRERNMLDDNAAAGTHHFNYVAYPF